MPGIAKITLRIQEKQPYSRITYTVGNDKAMYVHSIPNNNDNQDVVSMGTNSAILARRVIDNAYQVMAVYMIGLAQAVDCLKIEDKLAPKTKALYQDIRQLVPVFVEDTPKYIDIATIINYLKTKKIEPIL